MELYGRIGGKNFHTACTQHTHLFHRIEPRTNFVEKEKAPIILSATMIGSQHQMICHILDLAS